MSNISLTPDFLEELRSRNDIVDVASKYITLNRRGANFWACCPIHNEKTPSFSIKQDGQFFKCFGCGESGNVITLVMKMENVDFLTAVEILLSIIILFRNFFIRFFQNLQPVFQINNYSFITIQSIRKIKHHKY